MFLTETILYVVTSHANRLIWTVQIRGKNIFYADFTADFTKIPQTIYQMHPLIYHLEDGMKLFSLLRSVDWKMTEKSGQGYGPLWFHGLVHGMKASYPS